MNILLAEDNDLNAEIAIELLKIRGPVCAGRRMENGLWNCSPRASRDLSGYSHGYPDA